MELTSKSSRTYAVAPTAAPEALVIRCYAPNFQQATDQFLEKELGLPRGGYIDLSVAGGVASFSEALRLPKDFRFMRENAELAMKNFKTVRSIILVSHEDCAKYRALSEVLRFAMEHISERQRNDLVEVGQTVAGIAGRTIEIRRFYAKFANPEWTQVVFEEQK
jgi:hypothetical protein